MVNFLVWGRERVILPVILNVMEQIGILNLMKYENFLKDCEKRYIPIGTSFELTYKCNLNCKHCYISPVPNKKELTTKECLQVIDILSKNGSLFLTLTGGEILTRKDFFEIAEYARNKGFILQLLTNGTLIDKKTAKKVKSLMPAKVEISLYGLRETHDYITGASGAFDKAINAIELLVKNQVPVVVKSLPMSLNYSEVWDVKNIAEKLGAFYRDADETIVRCDNGVSLPLEYKMSNGQLRKYFKNKVKHGYTLKYDKSNIKNSNLCTAAHLRISISPYGDVNPCLAFRRTAGGNLINNSFEEIWNDASLFKKLRKLKVENLKECYNCKFFPFCTRCSGIALLEKGDLTASVKESCRLAKIRKEVFDELYGKNIVLYYHGREL